MEDITSTYQRYEDADLVEVEPQVALTRKVGSSPWWSLVWVLPLLVLVLAGSAFYYLRSQKPEDETAKRFVVPEDVNPFTVLTVLRDIKQRNGIDDKKSEALNRSINRVEEFYFGRSEKDMTPDDLQELAEKWVAQSN